MRTLLQLVQTAGAHVPAVSRIHISHGVGRADVTISIARMARSALGIHTDGVRPIPKGPTRWTDHNRRADQNPPIKLHAVERIPDITGNIDLLTLSSQIAELDASELVGRLNVERTGSGNTIISTHAGTRTERDNWLRGLNQ